MGRYLIYRIDKGLSVAPTQTFNRLSFIGVGEDGCNHGDGLGRGKRAAGQFFPQWNSPANEKSVRPTANPWSRGWNSQVVLDFRHLWTQESFLIPTLLRQFP